MTYVSIEGKVSNFAHDALKYVCLTVYYSNSVKSLLYANIIHSIQMFPSQRVGLKLKVSAACQIQEYLADYRKKISAIKVRYGVVSWSGM